jgi:uncharacterized membrane protein
MGSFMAKVGRGSVCVALAFCAWLGNFLYAAGVPGGALKYWSPALVAGAMIVFLVLHGRVLVGGRRLAAFLGIVLFVGWFYETTSLTVGFPIPGYAYADLMAPFLGHVPLFVMAAYCVMGYASWALARLLLGRTSDTGDRVLRYGVPLLATLLMVVWDLSMDPLRATVEGRWVWLDGGPHFGVPLHNFAGWMLVTWTMFQAFALLPERYPPVAPPAPGAVPGFWVSVPLVYGSFLGEYIFNPLVYPAGGSVLVNGALIEIADIHLGIALLSAATMGPIVLAGLRAARIARRVRRSTAGGEALARQAAS